MATLALNPRRLRELHAISLIRLQGEAHPLRGAVSQMSEFLPKEVRAGLEEARRRDLVKRSRLRVLAGDEIYPILRQWEDGFSLDAGQVAHLRGLVDIFEGSRHLSQCLIVASGIEGGELICTMKRSTAAIDRAPLDFERDENAPSGYLPRA